jgi:FdhE protein
MPRTAAGLRTNSSARLADLERRRPEWKAWFGLRREVEPALEDGRWDSAVEEGGVPDDGSTPLLHRRTLRVDGARLQDLIRRLSKAASRVDGEATLRRFKPTIPEAVSLTASAVRQRNEEIAVLAAAGGLDPNALISLAHLAALPLLRAAGRVLQQKPRQYWRHGYCPVCAGWPTLAERRGLDRSRWLRCGRCASGWEMEWLTCSYCGERNHERLGTLVTEDAGELHKVETCSSCRGYLKSVACLQALQPFELLLVDLETVEFDLAALDRDYRRPVENGFALELQLVDDAPRRRL